MEYPPLRSRAQGRDPATELILKRLQKTVDLVREKAGFSHLAVGTFEDLSGVGEFTLRASGEVGNSSPNKKRSR